MTFDEAKAELSAAFEDEGTLVLVNPAYDEAIAIVREGNPVIARVIDQFLVAEHTLYKYFERD